MRIFKKVVIALLSLVLLPLLGLTLVIAEMIRRMDEETLVD